MPRKGGQRREHSFQLLMLLAVKRKRVTYDLIQRTLDISWAYATEIVQTLKSRDLLTLVDREYGAGGRRNVVVFGPTEKTAAAITIPPNTEFVARMRAGVRHRDIERPKARERTSAGSGVIAGPKVIRGYVF